MAATWSFAPSRSTTATEALTEAAPALAADGVNLEGVSAVVPIVHAPVGQTFTGAGRLLGYVYHPSTGWVRFPRGDYDLAEVSALQDAALPSFEVNAPRGRFALIASGVGLSGAGTQITIDFLCVVRPTSWAA